MVERQATHASFPGFGRLGGLVQAAALLTLVAGAGLLAIFAFAGESPPLPGEPASAPPPSRSTLLLPRAPVRLLILVESEERATTIRAFREAGNLFDHTSFAQVEVTGPLPTAVLSDALLFANVACKGEGCERLEIIDLRVTP